MTDIARIRLPRGPNGEKDPNDYVRSGLTEELREALNKGDTAENIAHTEPEAKETLESPPLDEGILPEDIDRIEIPPRPWVIPGRIMRGTVTCIAGPPGVGKSAFEIATALSIASGKELIGEKIQEPGRVWIYNNEEDKDEMLRRYVAFCRFHGFPPSEYMDLLRLSSGYGSPLVIAKKVSTGEVIPTPRVGELIKLIKDNQVLVFSVDPIVSTHHTEENSNTDAEQVMTQWRHIAQETGAAIILPTHIRKTAGDSEAHAGDMEFIRGASSVVGAARQVCTLARMSKTTAKEYGIDDSERIHLVRLDNAKANYAPPAESAHWLEMRNQCLDNDPGHPDWVGVFRKSPHEFEKVTNARDQKFNDRARSLRIAISMLGLQPGEKRPLSAVKEDLMAHADLSRSWIYDNLVKVLPKQFSTEAEINNAEYTWTKDSTKQTAPIMICRELP